VGSIALRINLHLRRTSWHAWLVVLLTVAALVLWSFLIPRQERKTDQASAIPLRPSPVSDGEMPSAPAWLFALQAFERRLGRPEDVGSALAAIYSIARTRGLELDRGQYSLSSHATDLYARYEIVLPVEGSDAAVRRFVEDVLRALPHAALEHVEFKREGVAATQVKSKLRIALYLSSARSMHGTAVVP
jgi:hypothetical protein